MGDHHDHHDHARRHRPRRAGPPGDRAGRAAVLASLAFLMVTLDSLVVITALPSIHTSLGGGTGSLQWIVNAYNLTFAAGIVTGAALGDRYGRRRVFMLGLVLFTLASGACALAPTLGWLVGFRAVQGVGAAIVTPVGLALVTDAFPASRRGAAIGLWGGVAGLGVAAGPLIGGAVTQGLDWHWIFWVNLPVGLVALAGCAVTIRAGRGTPHPLDLPGLALVGLGLAALVDAVVEAPRRGWTAPVTLGLLTAGALALAGFAIWERYAAAPMIPPRLLRVAAFVPANVANMFSAAATFSAAYVTSQYFQFGRGDSPLRTGLAFLPWTAMPLIFAPLAGAWCDRVGARRLAVPGLIMQAAGFAAIIGLAGGAHPWAAFVAPFVVAGIGVSLALPTLPAAALGAVAPAEIGVAAGVVNTVARLGPVVGVAVVSAVFAAHGTLASTTGVTGGFRWALGASALLSLAGAAFASTVGRRRTPVEG